MEYGWIQAEYNVNGSLVDLLYIADIELHSIRKFFYLGQVSQYFYYDPLIIEDVLQHKESSAPFSSSHFRNDVSLVP